MRPRRLTEAEQRALTLRQGELTALAQHPSWPVLEAVVGERVGKFHQEAAMALLRDEGMPPERQHYVRGFIKGSQYVLWIPANAEARLETFLREHAREEKEADGAE